MAEEVLVGRPLLPGMIAGGDELVNRLVKDGFPPSAAFWMQEEPSSDWKLFIASSGLSSDDSFNLHKRVLDRAPKIPSLYWPSLVRLEDTAHSVVRAVTAAVKEGHGLAHQGWATVNLFSTAWAPSQIYVYRLTS